MESSATRTHGCRGRQAAFVHDSRQDVNSLHVIGDIDLANAADFEAALTRLSPSRRPIKIDLTCCTYMDSSALNVLLEANKRFSFGVVAAQGSIAQRVFTVMKDSKSLSIEYKPLQTIDWDSYELNPRKTPTLVVPR